MTDLDTYLARHFLDIERFAAACGISTDDLRELVRERLVPGPSYVVSESALSSYVFGRMPAPGAIDGEYFHPATTVWVKLARDVLRDVGRSRAHDALKQRFAANFEHALAELNASTWRLRDSFADDGALIAEGMHDRVESAWDHFLHGTFGLCVANPVSEAAIARKEVLQEKLAALSDAAIADRTSEETREVLRSIDAYAAAAMPFSPIEYPLSSRKRLVEDLSARIAAREGARHADPASTSREVSCN
jgi:hypothetical protein